MAGTTDGSVVSPEVRNYLAGLIKSAIEAVQTKSPATGRSNPNSKADVGKNGGAVAGYSSESGDDEATSDVLKPFQRSITSILFTVHGSKVRTR